MSANRHIFRALYQKYGGNRTDRPSCFYVLNPNDEMHPIREEFINRQRQTDDNGSDS